MRGILACVCVCGRSGVEMPEIRFGQSSFSITIDLSLSLSLLPAPAKLGAADPADVVNRRQLPRAEVELLEDLLQFWRTRADYSFYRENI